jgi:hypothetical protein
MANMKSLLILASTAAHVQALAQQALLSRVNPYILEQRILQISQAPFTVAWLIFIPAGNRKALSRKPFHETGLFILSLYG